MSQLTKDQIFAADDLPIETVEIPEWGGTVRVRTLTGADRDIFEDSINKARRGNKIDLRGLKAKLVSLTVLGDNNELLFDPTDLLALNQKSAKVIDQIFQVAQRLNGLSADDVEEMVKNSTETTADDSGSA